MSASVFNQWNVRPVINGVGPATRLGGSVMEPAVLEAMADAASHYVKIDELQDAASKVIAEITGAEAGYVTCGAAAGLALATAACMTGLDPEKMNRLPDTTGMRNEVIIHRAHRYDYDHALRSVGASLVEIGFPDAIFPYELERAITDRTAAVAYFPTPNRPALPLPLVVEIAHRAGVPVIVDAALEVPPVANFRTFTEMGADLVVFSGGKAIQGPQASGFIAGRADLIRAIGFQNQDMDVHPETWTYRGMIAAGEITGAPHHGIGRQMKVGKEEIVGLLVALQRYMERDHAADHAAWECRMHTLRDGLAGIPGVTVEVVGAFSKAGAVPCAVIRIDEDATGITAYRMLEELQEGEPRIFLNEERAWQGIIGANPMCLGDDDMPKIVSRFREIISG
ncbi:MAG: aminotransferase class V-fold PLP-dependent enzyme [Chloroflexota bacterium]|nr:aminotransferase class V-fold PLP-dependent enzyme [Chloroflexota bacterium]